ncbi:insulinase family protein [Sphingorhabdus soli]|uniref:Insulinase family protein n=2 Tax=Flavisphingopyxis soli TaxID=2601267 RepID=A0A5C6UP59_9SPHN|nr:insulinase family protein [Sphingorhabdus soli]
MSLGLALSACATMPATSVAPATVDQTAPPVAAVTGQTGWGYPVYDIAPDPAVRYGTLPNGMKYAILRNATPKDSASVRMRVDFGSIAESDDEQGLAHFIEHMAFNGSKNVPEGDMVKILERKGLAFGADTNASTGFDATVYQLDLPKTDDDMIDTALMLMRETAGNLAIAPDAVGRERGVILSEMRTRDSFQLRRIKDYLGFVAPQAPFATRLPIGTQQVLENASAADIRSLYERYYRPEKTTLVLVGDFDPAAIEAKIQARFADWRGVGPAGADLDEGRIDVTRPAAADTFVDPDVPYIVSIDSFQPYVAPAETIAQNRRSLLEQLGNAIVNRRFEKIANAPDSPILGASASTGDLFKAARDTSISVTAREGAWKQGLTVGQTELNRALQYGFTQAELAEQLANFQLAFDTAANQADTRRSASLANGIVGTVDDQSLFTTPAANRELFNTLKPTFSVDAVNAAFRARWAGSPPLVHVSAKAPIAGGDAGVLAAFDAAKAIKVEAPAAAVETAFAYDDFGTPGAVVADTVIADLGVRTITFANNVRLNLKKTDFEQGKLRYSIRIGSGELQLPADQPGLALLMSSMFANAGLGQHSFDDLQQVLAGHDVSPGLVAGDDSFGSSGTTTMADLPLQLKVTAAYLTDPGYRAEAQSRWASLVPTYEAQLDATPQSVAARDVGRILASGDQRFGIPDEATLLSRNLGELKAALTPILASAPIEIGIVGDIDGAAVIAAVASSFGALPTRDADFGAYDAARTVRFPAGTTPVTLTHGGTPDQGLALAYWPTDDDSDAVETARVDMLAEVMGILLIDEVREKLGATYSPNASSDMSRIYKDYGTFGTSVVVAPSQTDEVFAAIDTIAGELRDAPVSADMLARARTPLLERIVKNRRENGWWLGVTARAQSEAARLDRYRTLEARVKAITPADLQAAARKYLVPGKELKIRIVPEAKAPAAAK